MAKRDEIEVSDNISHLQLHDTLYNVYVRMNAN